MNKENTIKIVSEWNFKLDRNFWTTLRTATWYVYLCMLLWICSPKHTHPEAACICSIISPMMMKFSLAFFLFLAITVDAKGKLIKCGFFVKWSYLMLKQKIVLFVCEQNKNVIVFSFRVYCVCRRNTVFKVYCYKFISTSKILHYPSYIQTLV